jgi:hypothetical protein
MPFRDVATVVVALYFIGERFPFSNFPMYSNFDEEARVVFVTDESGGVLPIKQLFRRASSSSKKMYKARLNRICRENGTGPDDASEDDRRAAAAWVLDELLKLKRPRSFEELTAGKAKLQLGIERIILEDGTIRRERTVLAEKPL